MTLPLVTTLFAVLLGSTVIAMNAVSSATNGWQRMMLFGILAGLLLYNGVGAVYPQVPFWYLTYYFGFLIAFVVAFKFFSTAFLGVSRQAGRALPRAVARVDSNPLWACVIWLYVGLHIVPLLYPEFRLHQLFFPPSPDLLTAFGIKWEEQDVDVLLKLVEYIKLLLGPFFYVALYRYRNHIGRLLFLLLALLYVQYVDKAYIGRGHVVLTLALVGLALWMHRPRLRPRLAFAGALLLPLVLVASYVYGVVRIGGTVGEFSFWEAVTPVMEAETSFPRDVGMPVIEKGARVDLSDYVKWIVTLPIPKILTGEIGGARINYEISEYVSGVSPGQKGWYVVLPGLIAESVYIYGNYFFWLHGVFIAFLAALVVRLMERTPQLLFLLAHVVLLFAYSLNRGGISSLLPAITNQFLLFYLYVFAIIFGVFKGIRVKPARTQVIRNL